MVQWQQEEKPLLVPAESGCAAGKNRRKQEHVKVLEVERGKHQ